MDVSVVVPLYNEQDTLPELHQRLAKALDACGGASEILFVDDGSSDRTPAILKELAATDRRVRALILRRNYGQTPALAAGFDHAAGDVVVAMDGDLQHDPAEIPRFLEKIREGWDVVSGWRSHRVDGAVTRRLPSRIANWAMARLSGVPIHDFGTTFKAYRREILNEIQLFGELHRFIPALAAHAGARITEIPISNIVRPAGLSKYGLGRVFGVFLDLLMVKFLVSYLAKPLRVFGAMALAAFTAGFAVCAALLLRWALDPQGHPLREHIALLLLGALLMLIGVQFFTLGVAAEIASRIYQKVRNQPIYRVRERLGDP